MARESKELARLRRIADEDNADPYLRRYAAIVDARAVGHSLREIGDVLGVSAEAVRQFIQRRETA